MIPISLVLLLATSAWAVEQVGTNITVYGLRSSSGRNIEISELEVRPLIVEIEQVQRVSERSGSVSSEKPVFKSYYLQHGLRSVKNFVNFRSLYQYIINSEQLYGLVFWDRDIPQVSSSLRPHLDNVLTFQENYNLQAFLQGISHPVPILKLTPDRRHFEDVENSVRKIGKVVFRPDSVFSIPTADFQLYPQIQAPISPYDPTYIPNVNRFPRDFFEYDDDHF